jgi:hypothetical protein
MVQAKGCPTRQRQGQGIAIKIGTIIGITITGLRIIGSHCCATMTLCHAGYPPPSKIVTERHMDGLIRYSSLILEYEEHL